jgi:AcrR family transcriptional regulator
MKVLPPTETTRQARRQETLEARQRIARDAALDAASRLFAENGFHETGMADIAREAGLSLKALYGVFGSKDDLFAAVLDAAFARLLPVLADDGDQDPGERILGLIDDLFALVEENRSDFLLYARGSDGVPAALRGGGRDPYEPYQRVIRERLTTLVQAAQDAGHAPGIPAEVVAQSLLATILAIARETVEEEPRHSVADAAPGVRALFTPLFGG